MTMRILDTMRKQTAVVWQNPIPNSFGGKSYNTPVEIRVRWSVENEWYKAESGEDTLSNAVVYSGIDLQIGEYLYLGNLSDLTTEQKSNPNLIGYRIERIKKIPTLDATEFLRKAML